MEFVIATHNKGKIVEFKRLLEPMGLQVVERPLAEPEETGSTFAENAYIKAAAACAETGLPCVADDSGLSVDYLDGAPGIYSARFAPQGQKRIKLLQMLEGVPKEQRGAHFTSSVCCVFPNGDVIAAEGKCYGTIAFESRGENGFGYDSIFEQDGVTFGELSDEEKDARSHRGRAFAEFEEKLKAYLNARGADLGDHTTGHRELRCEVRPFGSLEPQRYTVVCSFYQGKYLLSYHEQHGSWETQGGHIEPGEAPEDAARRELYEESGVKDAELVPVCDFFGWDSEGSANGRVWAAVIRELGDLPESEMARVRLFDQLPVDRLTYPQVTPVLFREAEKALRARGEA